MTRLTDDGRVEFRFYRPDASDVRIAGDFNQWDRSSLVMQHDGNGWWTTTAEINSGDHRFRYCADGKWYTDYAANGVEQSKLGWNSIVSVPKGGAAWQGRSSESRISGSDITGKEQAKKQNKEKLVA